MEFLFQASSILFGATLISAQATPLTALISRFAQVPSGINLDNGLVLWLDASNLNSTITSPQGNVNTWLSSNNANQSLAFSAPSNAQAPQLNLAHSRFPGYPVSNLRFVRSLSQYYQFSPKPSQEFPTNFENGTTIFTLAAFGFTGSAGPANFERIFDFSPGISDSQAILFGRYGPSNFLFIRYSNALCVTPPPVSQTPPGESSIYRITGQPNGRLQVVRNGNESSNPNGDGAMGTYIAANRTATAFIGKSNWPNDVLLEGSIGEILIWNKVLNSTEMSFVYSYLNAKYFGCGAGGFGAYPACTACPVNTFSSLWNATTVSQCQICPAGSSTEGLSQRSACVLQNATTSTAIETLTSSSTSISMVTALDTISTLSVSSSAPVLDIINNPNSTSLGIQAAVMTPILKQTMAGAVASTEASKLGDMSSSLNSNMVICASAASGGAALLGISDLLLFRRQKNQRQLALLADGVQNKFQSTGITQLSANLYPGGRNTSRYAPNTGLINRPTNGMQTTGGLHLGQTMSKTGWNGFPSGPGGFYLDQGSGIGNMSATAQLNQFPTLLNSTAFIRLPSYVGTMNSGSTFGSQLTSPYEMTATEQPRFSGNTITVVPKSTMRF